MPAMRVFFSNLGCKLNQAELEQLARQFIGSGYSTASSLEDADIHVVNTCTVTHVAARRSRKLARQGKRKNSRLLTVLTGCYATADPGEAANLAGVDLIVPNDQKDQLVDRVQQKWPMQNSNDAVRSSIIDIPYVPLAFGNTRALVKIEDGCNMSCAFCIIPSTRGRQTSREADEIVTEIRDLVEKGTQEIVITGVQISAYGSAGSPGTKISHSSGTVGLYDLVNEILASTQVGRLRLTSIAPWDFDLRILDLFNQYPTRGVERQHHPRLCRHFHLSLQSGSASTLNRMRRPYSPGRFERLLSTIRERIPGVAITTDIIVGFPGETDEEFQDTLDFAERCRFARIHAFPYSSRPGTLAAGYPDQIPHDIKKSRMERMLVLADRTLRQFAANNLDPIAQVLWEQQRQGIWIGTTDNYIQVSRRTRSNLEGVLAFQRSEDLSASSLHPGHKVAPIIVSRPIVNPMIQAPAP
jgi:threonylcarbamoyladenosine tRNA methylthiotransferase MtaB